MTNLSAIQSGGSFVSVTPKAAIIFIVKKQKTEGVALKLLIEQLVRKVLS